MTVATDMAACDANKVRIDVIGLGPGREGLVSAETLDVIDNSTVRIARTVQHPSIGLLNRPTRCGSEDFTIHYCDDFYESLDTFDEVYTAIVELVVSEARQYGHVLYCVPGSARVAESTVERLEALCASCGHSDIEVVIHPALSFLDLTWVELGIDPVDVGVRIADAYSLSKTPLSGPNPVLISQCHSKQILSDIKLSVTEAPKGLEATVLQRLGTKEQAVFRVPWSELDRAFEPDHLTSIYVEGLEPGLGASFERFAELVKDLRQLCPWDREQTHASLRRYLLEESYETLEAIDEVVCAQTQSGQKPLDAAYEHLAEELGDLLFQVFLHSELADEVAAFNVASVVDGVYEKLYSRHDHVFSEQTLTREQLGKRWEAHKKAEKQRESVMDGIALALPALLLCTKVVSKAERVDIGGSELLSALRTKSEGSEGNNEGRQVAVSLFETVLRSRSSGVDAESALRELVRDVMDYIRTRGL